MCFEQFSVTLRYVLMAGAPICVTNRVISFRRCDVDVKGWKGLVAGGNCGKKNNFILHCMRSCILEICNVRRSTVFYTKSRAMHNQQKRLL